MANENEIELQQYELQLQQITEAIEKSTDSESVSELISLKENILELIALTKENLDSSSDPVNESDDPLADEYALFKAEIDKENGATESATVPEDDGEGQDEAEDSIREELSCLVGNKCQAPFYEQWSKDTCTYHNALIMSVDAENLESIKVKVMFVNPTCKEMVPCAYFLDGECKYSYEQCHFSHGYIVNFSQLKEYKEPDFHLVKENVAVLAKDLDNVWKRAIVVDLLLEENQCAIRYESGNKQLTVIDMQNILPLSQQQGEEFSSESEDCEDKHQESDSEERKAMLVEKSLLQEPPPVKLGEWEKHTKSIGSRLMASMGYVVGTGLGKHGEGRVEPVTAVVLPPGKSLDHCMELREKAGGDPNLFRADRMQKKLQNKVLARQNRKNNRRAKSASAIAGANKQDSDVFSFINNSLSGGPSKSSSSSYDTSFVPLKKSSAQELNVQVLKTSQSIDKKKYELYVLGESLSRQKHGTISYNAIRKKLKQAQTELTSLQNTLDSVNKEQSYRQTMKELTEF